MIKLENHEVVGWEHAIRGMRNPMNSWKKIDSVFVPAMPRVDIYGETVEMVEAHYKDVYESVDKSDSYISIEKNSLEPREFWYEHIDIGPNDAKLMRSLAKAGSDHRKFMRMITVYVDIIAPLYWWKEFDTYKVGTVANSCSTMHKIHAKEFELDDFSHEHLDMVFYDDKSWWDWESTLESIIDSLNYAREKFLETKDKRYWWQMIQLLPSSYNQKRTVMLNYEVLTNMYHARKNHKLDEWHDFCDWVRGLPYSELIVGEEEK